MLTSWLVSDAALEHKLDGESFYTLQLEHSDRVEQRLAVINSWQMFKSGSHAPILQVFTQAAK